MDPSVCRLHPGVAVTGFCPACLRDRLAGLQPPSADLRRCKSFSYARSAAASHLEPQRRSCDLFRQEPGSIIAVPEQEEERRMEASRKSSSFGGLLSKKLQQWRRKKKEHSFRVGEQLELGMDSRRSCDLGSYASWESGLMFDRLVAPAAEEDSIPRSDGQIPVEEEDYYDKSVVAVPGGCAQTREYYLDSSSSSRRRRSSTTSGHDSFSDVAINNELPTNARVSPAIAHHQSSVSVLVHQHHHQYRSRDWDQAGPTNFSGRRDDDFSGSFGWAFRANKEANKPNKKKGIKGWSIWGLIHKKSSRKLPEADVHRSSFSPSGAGVQVEYPWPEFRARGYNGQMLRCNSSISARRSISGMETQHDGSGRMRMDEVLMERTMSTRSNSYSTSGHDHPMGAAANYQFNHNGVRSPKSKPSALPRTRRSTLGPYSSTDTIPRQ